MLWIFCRGIMRAVLLQPKQIELCWQKRPGIKFPSILRLVRCEEIPMLQESGTEQVWPTLHLLSSDFNYEERDPHILHDFFLLLRGCYVSVKVLNGASFLQEFLTNLNQRSSSTKFFPCPVISVVTAFEALISHHLVSVHLPPVIWLSSRLRRWTGLSNWIREPLGWGLWDSWWLITCSLSMSWVGLYFLDPWRWQCAPPTA